MSPTPEADMPALSSDTEVETSFSATLAEAASVMMKMTFSDAVSKASSDLLLLSAAVIALSLGAITLDRVQVPGVSFNIPEGRPLVLGLIGALLFLLWNLRLRVINERHVNEYSRAVVISKLRATETSIRNELQRLDGIGQVNPGGMLRQKLDLLAELIKGSADAETVKFRIAFVYPTSIAVIAIVFGGWFVIWHG